jgi:hypothetical protein
MSFISRHAEISFLLYGYILGALMMKFGVHNPIAYGFVCGGMFIGGLLTKKRT